jgi:hypothetical protein
MCLHGMVKCEFYLKWNIIRLHVWYFSEEDTDQSLACRITVANSVNPLTDK